MKRILFLTISLLMGLQMRAQMPYDVALLTGHVPFYLANLDSLANLSDYDILITEAQKHLGTPYRSGGKTPKGFDCAGFTRYLFRHIGVTLAPYAGGQYPQGHKIKDTKDLKPGDLAFWGGRTGSRKVIGHVGMVTEVDTATGVFVFIHSATSGGIRYDRSSAPYYKSRYVGACRIIKEKPEVQVLPPPAAPWQIWIDAHTMPVEPTIPGINQD